MNLIAIYNVFDGLELLKGSIEQIRDQVDGIVIVAQSVSNWGEHDPFVLPYCDMLGATVVIEYSPGRVANFRDAQRMEIGKRQAGITWAREHGYSHFISMDCDEYYTTEGFEQMKKEADGRGGSYHPLRTYYKNPGWRFENYEKYYVPGIHEIKPGTVTGWHSYPVLVDPTRRINERDVRASEVIMHHFSYIRLDIAKKLRNSTARENIHKPDIFAAYKAASVGKRVSHVDAGRLEKVTDQFNIHEQIEEFIVQRRKPV